MALKDNWIDRQNGVDDVDSEDINKVARAVIEAEKRLDDVGIGATFFPYVSESGIISWTNDGGLPNPPPLTLKEIKAIMATEVKKVTEVSRVSKAKKETQANAESKAYRATKEIREIRGIKANPVLLVQKERMVPR